MVVHGYLIEDQDKNLHTLEEHLIFDKEDEINLSLNPGLCLVGNGLTTAPLNLKN